MSLMKKQSQLFLSVLFILFLPYTKNLHSKEIINGYPKIIDGDTLVIKKLKIRLFGIDAPEKKQKCKKVFLSISMFSFQKQYDCGGYSTTALKKKIQDKEVKCISKSKDKYNRYIAICYLKKLDINKWMVSNGYAIAYKRYSKKYVADEEFAKQNKSGLWRGEFMNPEKWRRISN